MWFANGWSTKRIWRWLAGSSPVRVARIDVQARDDGVAVEIACSRRTIRGSFGKSGWTRDPEEALLAAAVQPVTEVEQGIRQHRAVLDDPCPAILARDEQPPGAVRRRGDRKRTARHGDERLQRDGDVLEVEGRASGGGARGGEPGADDEPGWAVAPGGDAGPTVGVGAADGRAGEHPSRATIATASTNRDTAIAAGYATARRAIGGC